jgi:hypothetical protein
MYLSDDSGPGQHKKWVHRRRPSVSGSGSGVAGLGEFGSPVFDVQCPNPPGCAPGLNAAACRAAIRAAVREAIRLANNAADKLEAAIAVPPASRDADAKRTAARFIRFFRHDPAHPISWAGFEESGVSVAKRLRAVARELDGGRRVVFHCRPTTTPCPDTDLTCCASTDNAWFSTGVRNGVNLCDSFWTAPAPVTPGLSAVRRRAGIIIHEMLHMLFEHLRDTGQGRIRAACYEAFALQASGIRADQSDFCACRGITPCPPA